jgi:hypothetical protein
MYSAFQSIKHQSFDKTIHKLTSCIICLTTQKMSYVKPFENCNYTFMCDNYAASLLPRHKTTAHFRSSTSGITCTNSTTPRYVKIKRRPFNINFNLMFARDFLNKPRLSWKEDNIKMDLTETAYESPHCVHRALDRVRWRAFINTWQNFSFHKRRRFWLAKRLLAFQELCFMVCVTCWTKYKLHQSCSYIRSLVINLN